MRITVFKGKDNKIYTLYAERNVLNGNVMYWFSHNPTMFFKGYMQVIKQLDKMVVISDTGQV